MSKERHPKWEPYDPTWLVDLAHAQKPDEKWQFKTNIHLDSTTEGWLALDVLQDDTIGGVEFVKRAIIGSYPKCPCGFVFVPLESDHLIWVTCMHPEYDSLIELENQLKKEEDRKSKAQLGMQKRKLRGQLYECPECNRIMWKKPQQSRPQIYIPSDD